MYDILHIHVYILMYDILHIHVYILMYDILHIHVYILMYDILHIHVYIFRKMLKTQMKVKIIFQMALISIRWCL
jgi:hypothetical protein